MNFVFLYIATCLCIIQQLFFPSNSLMATVKNSLSITSYNCEYANEIRLPFLQHLLKQSDFLLLQEHGLYKSRFDWFDKIGDVSYHGVSAMDEKKLLKGRPNGGAVILWKNTLENKVCAIPYDSKRICAVTMESNLGKVLIINVYMPCDDNKLGGNVIEYKDILNDICILCNSTDATHLVIMGDFNTDLCRNNVQTKSLLNFINSNDFYCCSNAFKVNVPFTYRSKINGNTSLIDHCITSENLTDQVESYCSIDNVDNASDHLGIKCVLSLGTEHVEAGPPPSSNQPSRPDWSKATPEQLREYGRALDECLLDIAIPIEAFECRDPLCSSHFNDISSFHDNIVNALASTANMKIPVPNKRRGKKVIPGWNEMVENNFRNALFWHKLWVENGRPAAGVIADIRRATRARYHDSRKQAIKNKDIITSSNLVKSLNDESSKEFWSKVRRCKGTKSNAANCVDNSRGETNICNVFKDKFKTLYNCVSYEAADMQVLKHELNTCIVNSDANDYNVTSELISKAIKKLKIGKNDSWLPHTSDSIIHGTNVLHEYLAVLFNIMIRHGHSPYGMLVGTMVPLPKGRWKSKRDSENYRAITLSSLLGKLLDIIIIFKEGEKLETDNLQFGYKQGVSTTMCTSILRETVSYYTTKGTSVYGLMLDATKAFDRVNYCKLFKILLFRDVNPLICRFLLNMYTNQALRVRWCNTFSDKFNVSNGVKQGGILSPILFAIYMDGLISNLRTSGLGCRMSRHYVGVIVYADDVVILAPSVFALRSMLRICVLYAKEYDVLFNDKSKLIVFPAGNKHVFIPKVTINGKVIDNVTQFEHLGHIIQSKILQCDATKCTDDFNTQCNSFLGNFANHTSELRNFLFEKYCTSFYGSQFLPLYNDSIATLCRAWRCGIRRVWRLPYRAHCNILPFLAGTLPPELMIAKRSIAFVKLMKSCNNPIVEAVVNVSSNQIHSILGCNIRHLNARYHMDVRQVYQEWKGMFDDNAARSAAQVVELCEMRDSVDHTFLSKPEIKCIIEAIVTD